MDMRKWFKEAQYGMMVHWGLYSLLAGEWRGKEATAMLSGFRPVFESQMQIMERLASAFNPIYFNAEEWVKFAKDCGMKYLWLQASIMKVLLCIIQK